MKGEYVHQVYHRTRSGTGRIVVYGYDENLSDAKALKWAMQQEHPLVDIRIRKVRRVPLRNRFGRCERELRREA